MSPGEQSALFLVDEASLRATHGLDETTFADVRFVGASLAARVPEMIEDFYGWLRGFSEFARFFADPQMLLRVKTRQNEYWTDFLAAEVDDAYVERRRIVGRTHARIELGLLIYLLAMEFVSAWMRRAIEADERLHGRATAALSIRKLIAFDSAIVVDTYGALTAQNLEEHRDRLRHIADVMRAVTQGDLDHGVEPTGSDDILGVSLNDLVGSLRGVAHEMEQIAGGDYSAQPTPRSAKDQIGRSLQEMTRALRRAAEHNERQIWIAETETALGQAMSGNPTMRQLAQRVLSLLCRALNAQVGAQYVAEDGGATLRLAGAYAAASGVRERWRLGEGLIGQVALEKRRVLVDVPEDGLAIHWGLGEAKPRHVAIFPLLHEGETRGVIELGALAPFCEWRLEALDFVSSSVGQAIGSAEARARIEQLLEEARAQGEELTAQQEELRQVNDTLEEHSRALELQKENLLATESALRQKAEELERTSRYKSEFLANMSHELRTPLNSSLILAKLLVENREGNLSPEQIKYAQSIYSAGNDLLALINDILDLSKIEAGKIELNVEPLSIATLLADLERRFEPLAAERRLRFAVVIEPGAPETIETDRLRLQQILSNLLANAVKFTERGGVRLIARRDDARRLAFIVEDTGIGIADDQHETIFHAFRQANGGITRKFGGTGLGLSISREFAELIGGRLTLRSAPGEGSAFTLLLPLRADRAPAWPAAAVRVEEQPPFRERETSLIDDDRDAATDMRRIALIVEDDAAFAEILRDLARELGFKCLIAGSADEALRLARQFRPDAVLLDIGLPDQSGLTVLELLKRDPSVRHAPIQVVSVHDYQKVALEMGAVGYILKPAKRDQLVAAFRLIEERLAREKKSILIVEDEGVQREALSELLSSADVEIVAVATAEEGLRQIGARPFDCVVLDLMLPGVSGFELLERIGREMERSAPPVIVYTARSLSIDEEQRLRRLSKSIIVKGARSPERLIEETTLFLHQAESKLTPEQQHMLEIARSRDGVLDGRRILLVEDDVRNIFSLTAVLEREGVAVQIARNGREALERIDLDPSIDLVLMDLMMPEMDGLTAIRAIRAREDKAALPIIALTAKAMPDDRAQCLAAGADDYISKPIDIEKLLSLIRVWTPK